MCLYPTIFSKELKVAQAQGIQGSPPSHLNTTTLQGSLGPKF